MEVVAVVVVGGYLSGKEGALQDALLSRPATARPLPLWPSLTE